MIKLLNINTLCVSAGFKLTTIEDFRTKVTLIQKQA